jgi:hypothetical protein
VIRFFFGNISGLFPEVRKNFNDGVARWARLVKEGKTAPLK